MSDILKELDEVIADNPDTDSAIGAYEIANVVRINLHSIRAALELQARVETYRFEIVQYDFPQAGGYAPVLADAEREAAHYAMIYGQDGPVGVNIYAVLNHAPPAQESNDDN